MGVEGVVHSRQVELGLRHQGGHGGVHLQHRPQLLAREVAGDQRRTGGPVGPGPHIQHIKDLGRGDISPGQRSPQHPVRCEGDQGLSLRQPGNGPGRPGKGVRRQLSQAISILNPRLGQWEEKVASGQHLVIGEAIGAQIADVHLLLPVLGQSGNLRVLPRRPVNGDQAVLLQGLLPRPVPGQGDAPQVFTVGPGGDNVGVPHHNGFRQGGVGMSRNDQVDLRHRPGQVLILRGGGLAGAAVGQADDKLRPLLLQPAHTALGRLGRVLQHKAGGGRAGVGVLTHQPKNAVGHAPPL